MNITKKVCIYILVGLITVTGTFTSFYKGAYAFEYVGGALAFEEAIKWLLASVGIISAGGMTADYWELHGQEFEDYCAQQNITDSEVADWQLKLCEGILDKGSACWQAFKDWASTLTGSSSGGDLSSDLTIAELFDFLCGYYGIENGSLNYDGNDVSNFRVGSFCMVYGIGNSVHIFDKALTLKYYTGNLYSVYDGSASGSNFYHKSYSLTLNGSNSTSKLVRSTSGITLDRSRHCILYNIDILNDSSYPITGNFDIISGDVSDSDFVSVQSDVTDLDIISSPIPDTDAQEVAIPMPGVADSDNDASASAYDDIIDAVNDGTLDLDDGITRIQEILKVIVYDDTNDKIFPTPEDPEDQEDLQDKINDNKDNMGFTLGGLENVFPFCIPWDIYAFMGLLRADPVPPKVELPFPNPLDPENPWLVEVDFSDWDDGMRIVRLAEDFLFIIGLAVLTRSLIGAGGGDG